MTIILPSALSPLRRTPRKSKNRSSDSPRTMSPPARAGIAGTRTAAAQLLRAKEIGVAPGRRLGLVAELLHRIGRQLARRLVAGLREHDLAHGIRHPAIFALAEILARPRDSRVCAAHVGNELLGALHRRQRIEVGGIGVVPAEVALVDRLGVVAQRAVVAAHVPLAAPALSAAPAARRSQRPLVRGSSAAASGRAGTCRCRAAWRGSRAAARCPTPASGAARTPRRPCARSCRAPR